MEEEEEEDEEDVDSGEVTAAVGAAAVAALAVGKDDDVDVITAPVRAISRHSSTSSLVGVGEKANSVPRVDVVDIAAIAAGLRKGSHQSSCGADSSGDEAGNRSSSETPTPFPVSSQIGTGGLSRQNSLRRIEPSTLAAASAQMAAAAAAAVSELKPNPPSSSTPSSPPSGSASSAASMAPPTTAVSCQSSPARYKMRQTKQLVATRSSPQRMLNQIREEQTEDGKTSATAGTSPAAAGPLTSAAASAEDPTIDPVDSFPQSAAGAAVLRRLEARRRLNKTRAASCSSSDASEDEGEGRKKRHGVADASGRRRDSTQHDDSSDSQDQQGGGAAMAGGSGSGGFAALGSFVSGGGGGNGGGNNGRSCGSGNGGGASGGTRDSGGDGVAAISRRHRAFHHSGSSRIRQSHSLNRISELHVVSDFNAVDEEQPTAAAAAATTTKLPAPDAEGSGGSSGGGGSGGPHYGGMLSRYLESLNNARNSRSREDSQNSSDGEFEPSSDGRSSSSRRHKVNLRVLEQRLNKIQEESITTNNKSDDDEEDDNGEEDEEGEVEDDLDNGDLSDDPSTLPEDEPSNPLTTEALENAKNNNTLQALHKFAVNYSRSRNSSESTGGGGGNFIQNLQQYANQHHLHHHQQRRQSDDTCSTKSCDVTMTLTVTAKKAAGSGSKKPLLRAHSCGSLMGLKEKALLTR